MAITLIQSAKVGSDAVLTPGILSIAFPSPVTAGNMLVATTYDSAGNAGVASDTQGNTYTQALHVSGLETPAICLAYAIAGSSGANTVSFDFGFSSQGCIIIAEYSGMGATPTVDQQNQNIPAPGSTVDTGAITTTSADELILAASLGQIGFPPSSASWGVDSSFTIEQQNDSLVPSNREMSFTFADRIVAATGTFDPTFTVTASQPQTFIEAGIVSFIPSGAPAPTTGVLKGNQQIATTRAGIKQRLITIPEMRSYDDVRKVMAKAVQDLQTHIATQLPVTNYLNKRISNVGTPMSADDVVTLRYLQGGGGGGNVSPVSVNVQQANGLGGGAADGVNIALVVPAEFAVSGSPVTGSGGTFTITKANESANTVFAGPTSGGAAAPTFRALVTADIPINFADNETPTGTINGVNVTFTLAHTPSPAASLQLFLSTAFQRAGTEYTLSGAAITFSVAPAGGTTLRAFYRY